MIATPAVACGTKTLHRPSPVAAAERAHRVGQVDDRAGAMCRCRARRSSCFRAYGPIEPADRPEETSGWYRWRHRGAAPTQGGWKCTHAQPQSRRNRDPSTPELRTCATRSCPPCKRSTGYVGLSLLVDRESGRCIATSAGNPRRQCARAPNRRRRFADSAVQMFGGARRRSTSGRSPSCIATTARATVPACGPRGSRCRPDQFDQAIDFYRTSVLPAIEELEGFCSASLMVDRETGRAVSSATFDSREAMERNRDQARALRNARTRETGCGHTRRRRVRARARPSAGARDGLIERASD